MSKEHILKEFIRTKLSEAGVSSKFKKAVEEYKEVSLKLQDLFADRAKALEGYKKAEGGEKEKYKMELSRIQKLVNPLQDQMEKAERVFNKALLSEPEELEEGSDDGLERVAAGLPQTEEEPTNEGKHDKEIKALEDKIKAVKGKTPADLGLKAVMGDDLAKLKAMNEGYSYATKLELQQYLVNLNTELSGEKDPKKIKLIKGDIEDVKKELQKRSNSKKESVNEASRRANEMFGETKFGQEIHKMLKGKWDAKKVENYLDGLGGGSTQKNLRIIDFISKDAGLNSRLYDTQTMGKQISDTVDKLEVLYKDFTKGTDVKKFDDVHIKSKNLTGIVYAISGNTLVVKTKNGMVKTTKDDVEAVMSDGVKNDESVNEAELSSATIPSSIKSKLVMAIDKIKDTKLTYNQKTQIIGQVMDSLGIDKGEFNKMSSKLKGTMESSIKEGSPCWDGYQQIGMKEKGGKQVPNCVPEGKVNEGNAFGMAVTQAKKEGKKEFEFNGKTYKVKKGKGKVNESDCGCGSKAVVSEAVKEPEVITKIRDIVKKHQHASIKDPKLGKSVKVDAFSASAIVQVYDAINDANKEKFAAMSIHQMATVAYKLMKK